MVIQDVDESLITGMILHVQCDVQCGSDFTCGNTDVFRRVSYSIGVWGVGSIIIYALVIIISKAQIDLRRATSLFMVFLSNLMEAIILQYITVRCNYGSYKVRCFRLPTCMR